MDESVLKERLILENAEFRKLHEEHQKLDRTLTDLSGKSFLTEDERLEERELKKRKLALKDRMYRMMTDARTPL
jgi:uncharacterized protein